MLQYRERLEDIRMLKLKINDLKRKLHMLKQQTSNIDVLRNEVYHLQRELLSERTKVCVRACVRACVRVRACVCVCVNSIYLLY